MTCVWWYNNITNFMDHDLAIIVMWNSFFISSHGIDMDVIHLFVLFEHRCHVHCLNTNVICLFVLFKHECCMFICVVNTPFLCLNNAQHSCLDNTNLWNKKFCADLEWTHEAWKFVMNQNQPTPFVLCTKFIITWELWSFRIQVNENYTYRLHGLEYTL